MVKSVAAQEKGIEGDFTQTAATFLKGPDRLEALSPHTATGLVWRAPRR